MPKRIQVSRALGLGAIGLVGVGVVVLFLSSPVENVS